MSSSTYPNAMKKNHFKFLLTLCVVALATQVIGPSSSLHAQGMDHSIPTNPPPPTVIINGAKQYQTIDGFGFSEAFGPADQLRTVSSTRDRTKILDLLFNTSIGAGFSILRNLLPSDAAHTIEPNNPGGPTATPQYVWDHNSWGQIWLAKQAQHYGVKQFYIDTWSAPSFMKTNGDEANGGTLCGAPGTSDTPVISCSTGDWRQAYANYLVHYIKDYKSDGISITHIGFVNEPNLKISYSSMVMTAPQMADFAKVLGTTLRASSFHPQVVCCEAQGWDLAQNYTNAITSDPTVNGYVGVISSHGYTGFPTFTLTGTGQKHIWQTEWSTFDAWDPSWDDGSNDSGFTWAQRAYTGLTAAKLSAFFYWWGLANSTDNQGLILYKNNAIETSKRLWALANYSRFVRPRAIRIGTTSSNSNLQLTAFKNTNGSISIIVLNTSKSDTPVTFSLQNTGITQDYVATPYITNALHNTAAQAQLSIQNQTFSATVPARSLVTYQVTPVH